MPDVSVLLNQETPATVRLTAVSVSGNASRKTPLRLPSYLSIGGRPVAVAVQPGDYTIALIVNSVSLWSVSAAVPFSTTTRFLTELSAIPAIGSVPSPGGSPSPNPVPAGQVLISSVFNLGSMIADIYTRLGVANPFPLVPASPTPAPPSPSPSTTYTGRAFGAGIPVGLVTLTGTPADYIDFDIIAGASGQPNDMTIKVGGVEVASVTFFENYLTKPFVFRRNGVNYPGTFNSTGFANF
jgi:hypothetical protein